MALSASPQRSSRWDLSSRRSPFRRTSTAPQPQAWILASNGALPAPPAPLLSPQPRASTEWRFGGLTLIRDVRPVGHTSVGALRSQRLRHQGLRRPALQRCGRPLTPSLRLAPAGLALAALEQSSRLSGSDEDRLLLLVPRVWLVAAARGRCSGSRPKPARRSAGRLHAPALRPVPACQRRPGEKPRHRNAGPSRGLHRSRRRRRSCHPAIALVEHGWNARARSCSGIWLLPDSGRHSSAGFWRCRGRNSTACWMGDAESPFYQPRAPAAGAARSSWHRASHSPFTPSPAASAFADHSTFSRAFRREYGCSSEPVARRPASGSSGAGRSPPRTAGCATCRPPSLHGLRRPRGEWDEQPRFGILS